MSGESPELSRRSVSGESPELSRRSVSGEVQSYQEGLCLVRVQSYQSFSFYLLLRLVQFMYLVFTRMPGESYSRRLRSLVYLFFFYSRQTKKYSELLYAHQRAFRAYVR